MYVEENGILAGIDENVPEGIETSELEEILHEGFCRLDMGMDDQDPDEVLPLLADAWGVEGKTDLHAVLDRLLKAGQQAQLEVIAAFAQRHPVVAEQTIASFRAELGDPAAGGAEADDEGLRQFIVAAQPLFASLPEGGVRGWDLARRIHLIRLGVLAHLLKGPEAWALVRQQREVTRASFADWTGFAASFRRGRAWWAEGASALDDACERLLSHPRSPWVHLGWMS